MFATLDTVVVGLAYLAVLLALNQVVRPLLVAVLSRAPFIGGWLSSNVDSGLGEFARSITPAANASLPIVSGWLDTLTGAGNGMLQTIIGAVEAVPAWLLSFVTISLPYAFGQLNAYAATLAGNVLTEARTLVATAEALASAATTNLGASVRALYTSAVAEARGLFATAELDAANLAHVAETDAGALFAQARTDLAQAVLTVETDVGAAVRLEHDFAAAAIAQAGLDIKAAELTAAQALGASVAEFNKVTSVLGSQLAAQPAEFQANLSKEIGDLKASLPWGVLEALANAGESVASQAIETLVHATTTEARSLVKDAAGWKQQYGPLVAGILAAVKRGEQV